MHPDRQAYPAEPAYLADPAYSDDERLVRHSHRRGPVRDERDDDNARLWLAIGTGALLGAAGVAWYARRQTEEERRRRPPDSAPRRTSRLRRDDGRALTGRTVTIDKPRAEVYAFWRDFSNLPKFMENVAEVTSTGEDTHRWTLVSSGDEVTMATRVVSDTENERVVWRTIEGSDIEAEGSVRFRDAPGERGTEVVATVRYRPPGGEPGRLAAKLLGRDPKTRVRRELKRMKMLLETGEIATSANRRSDVRG